MKRLVLSRIFLSILCVICLLTSLSSNVFAESARLSSTKDFINFVESEGLQYNLEGMDEDCEYVSVTFGNMSNYNSLTCVLGFYTNCDEVSLWMWDIVNVNPFIDESALLKVINAVNSTFRFAKFVYDDTDSTIYAQIDMCIDENHCGKPVFEAMYTMFSEVDSDLLAGIFSTLK